MKVYSIYKSPLYKLSNKRKLATLLSCDIKELKKLKYSRQNYNVWGKKKKNNTETRSIESPKPFIKRLQKNTLSVPVLSDRAWKNIKTI